MAHRRIALDGETVAAFHRDMHALMGTGKPITRAARVQWLIASTLRELERVGERRGDVLVAPTMRALRIAEVDVAPCGELSVVAGVDDAVLADRGLRAVCSAAGDDVEAALTAALQAPIKLALKPASGLDLPPPRRRAMPATVARAIEILELAELEVPIPDLAVLIAAGVATGAQAARFGYFDNLAVGELLLIAVANHASKHWAAAGRELVVQILAEHDGPLQNGGLPDVLVIQNLGKHLDEDADPVEVSRLLSTMILTLARGGSVIAAGNTSLDRLQFGQQLHAALRPFRGYEFNTHALACI